MTPREWVDIIKEVGGTFMIIATAVGIVWTGLTSFQKARTENRANEAKIVKDEAEREVELTERLKNLSDAALSSMEERLNRMEARMLAKENEAEAWQGKYWQSERRSIEMGEAGLKLIEAIEAGFKAREASAGINCAACVNQDHEMMIRLNEIKVMFRRSATGGHSQRKDDV